jgi:hypothetical protein
MTRLLLLMNGTVVAILLGLWLLIDYRGLDFAFGLFTGCMGYQIAHRLTYGRWFEGDGSDEINAAASQRRRHRSGLD